MPREVAPVLLAVLRQRRRVLFGPGCYPSRRTREGCLTHGVDFVHTNNQSLGDRLDNVIRTYLFPGPLPLQGRAAIRLFCLEESRSRRAQLLHITCSLVINGSSTIRFKSLPPRRIAKRDYLDMHPSPESRVAN